MVVRPRRSVLYMPGANLRALEKARTLPADALVLDLEDSVGPEKKIEARNQVIAAVKAGGYGRREIIVRANSLESEWGQKDVQAIAQSGADGLCLPKVERSTEVEAAIEIMNDSGAPASMPLWLMIETPLGVININQIVAADPRVAVVVMGTTDLAKELHTPHTPERIGLQHSLGQCLLAARAFNKDILDGVYLDLEDDVGFASSCRQGRDMGFDGKTLIHPRQLQQANRAFGLDEDDLKRARKIIDAWKLAEAQGSGVVVVDGKLVEGMHVDEARRHLQIAQRIVELECDQ